MNTSKTFRDVIAWQRSHTFVLVVYKITSNFPKSEMYGLTSQFRRSATSIAANIAEGFGKKGLADKARFMNIAQGSLEECQYYIILIEDLGYAPKESCIELKSMLDEASRTLNAYCRAIIEAR